MTNFPAINSSKIFGEKALVVNVDFKDSDDYVEIEVEYNNEHALNRHQERITLTTVVTCYATFFNYTTSELKFKIGKEELFGRVEVKVICSFNSSGVIQITDAIDTFYNDSFIVEKGEIISDFTSYYFNINDENEGSETIVKFNYNKSQIDYIDIRFDLDIILVTFNDKDLFDIMIRLNDENPDLAISILPATAIISSLEYIKDDNVSYEDKGWYQKIEDELQLNYGNVNLKSLNPEETFKTVFNKLFLIDKLKIGLNRYYYGNES